MIEAGENNGDEMSERRKILELWNRQRGLQSVDSKQLDPAIHPDAAAVLVTLVRVEGSSYRKPGARLLAYNHAEAGSISGGCLEGEILRKASWITRAGATMQRYSTLFDDTSEIPYGLGCGGVVELLFEPLHLPETQALLAALERSQAGERSVVLTLLPGTSLPDETRPASALQRMVLRQDGSVLFASDSLSVAARRQMEECALAVLRQKATLPDEVTLSLDNMERAIFIESIEPPQRLIIFGAGKDAQPLVRMAQLLGWRVVVADGRPSLARKDFFPAAESVHVVPRQVSRYGDALAELGLNASDAVVLLTHSYEQDRALLPQLLPLNLRYVGVL